MSAVTGSLRRGGSALVRIDLDRLARPALVACVIGSGLLLFHLTRGTSFWADDWIWIVTRRGDSVRTFLGPYNGHLSLVPIAIYRVMFAVFGLRSYTPYRVVIIVLSLIVAVLLFAYARPRVGELAAMLAAAAMLFLGPGWQDTMWAFQIPWLIVCAAGICALVLIERRRPAADLGACALVLLAICSTSLGLAFAVGIGVDLALTRRRWSGIWIWAVPLGLYVIWALVYHPDAVDLGQIPAFPVSVAQAAAASLSAVLGVSGLQPSVEPGTALTYGWPLLVIAAGLICWRARHASPEARDAPARARAVALGAVFVVFAASVSIVHAGLASPLASRYIYVYCLLALMIAVELARGMRMSRAGQLCLIAVTLVAVVSNLGSLRAYGNFIRSSGAATNGALTALDLDRTTVSPSTIVHVALWQFVGPSAGSYFAATRTLGTPAYSLAQLRVANALGQSSADTQLLADGDVRLTQLSSRARAAPRTLKASPLVVGASGGSVARSGSCVRFTPAAALAPAEIADAQLRLGEEGVVVTAGRSAVTLSVRRFAATVSPLGTLGADRAASVTVRRDAAPEPWYLQLSSISPVRVCTLHP